MGQGLSGQMLFHGTAETFELPPRPGGYDNVLWTAESPAIAQTYIPRAGITTYGNAEASWIMADRVRPLENSFWYLVVRNMGFEATEVHKSPSGELLSWRLPEGYPSYAEAREWLEGLGYRRSTAGIYEVSIELTTGVDKIRPAAWRKQGRLLFAENPGLRLLDLVQGRESDLQDLDYHKIEAFREAEAAGYDGVVITDFLQDKEHGNVGHRSIGLFAAAAAQLNWEDIPAVNHAWLPGVDTTPEYDAWLARRPDDASGSLSRP